MTNVRNEEFIKAFGKRVRKLREERKLSQEELAFRAGISANQLSRIEIGAINTSISMAAVLAKALEVEIGEIFK